MKDTRFESLTYPIHKFKDSEDLVVKLGFQSVLEFSEYPEQYRNNVIRYVVLLFDKGTPLIREYTDLSERKEAALTLAKFERTKKGNWPEHVLQIRDMYDDQANRMILKFMDMQHHMKLDMILTFEEMFNEYKALLLRPVLNQEASKSNNLSPTQVKAIYTAADFKKKLREECMSIRTDLDVLYKEVYGDNEDLLKKSKTMRMTNPEQIASSYKTRIMIPQAS